jgi:hypothetical protein
MIDRQLRVVKWLGTDPAVSARFAAKNLRFR